MPKPRLPLEPPAPPTPGGVRPKLLQAGEVARLAGLHRTTILLAVRRGEIRASRTVGRSVRITLPDAAAYLLTRGISLTVDSSTPTEPRTMVVLTEQAEVHRRVGEALPPTWQLVPHHGLYEDLITLGHRPPSAVVLDLDVLGLNPLAVLRALHVSDVLGQVPVLALSQVDGPLAGALAQGAEFALRASDLSGWRSVLAALD